MFQRDKWSKIVNKGRVYNLGPFISLVRLSKTVYNLGPFISFVRLSKTFHLFHTFRFSVKENRFPSLKCGLLIIIWWCGT